MNHKNEGDSIRDFVGPLGRPTVTTAKKVAIVGGGVGCAIAYPVAKKFHQQGSVVHSVVGFRSRDLVILEREFAAASDRLVLMTDDGSYGKKGLVTDALKELIEGGEAYDEVIAIGPLVMMKFVCKLTKEYGIRTMVSMNPIMIDGTGMCGCCRLTVGGRSEIRLCGRAGFRRPSGGFRRDHAARGNVPRIRAKRAGTRLQSLQKGGGVICRTCP